MPSFCGAGLLQIRRLKRNPPPQDTEHLLHVPNGPQPPSTGGFLGSGHGGKLEQYTSFRSVPTHVLPPCAGAGLPEINNYGWIKSNMILTSVNL